MSLVIGWPYGCLPTSTSRARNAARLLRGYATPIAPVAPSFTGLHRSSALSRHWMRWWNSLAERSDGPCVVWRAKLLMGPNREVTGTLLSWRRLATPNDVRDVNPWN